MKDPDSLELPRLRQLFKMSDGEEWGQDRDLIWANEDWVEELLGYYESESLSDDEKNVLMQLIIASYDEKLRSGSYNSEIEKGWSIFWKMILKSTKILLLIGRDFTDLSLTDGT